MFPDHEPNDMNVLSWYLNTLENSLTLLVISCECETSASTVKGLHTFMCVSMKNKLLSLALIHVHYDMEVNRERGVVIFSQVHPSKMELASVL